MKICYVSHTDIPSRKANAIQSLKMCQAMTQVGHEVIFIGLAGKMAQHDIPVEQFYGLSTPFPLRLLRRASHLRRLEPYWFAWQAWRQIKRERPDGVFTRFLPIAWLALRAQSPTILELHALQDSPTERFFWRQIATVAADLRLITISHALKRDFLARYPQVCAPQAILVAPDGVDLARYEALPDKQRARAQLDLPLTSSFVAGYVGHFYPGKGADFILQMARQTADTCFLLVGGTPHDQARLRRQIEQWQLTNVVLRDFVPNEQVPRYLAACDVLLLPLQRRVLVGGKQDIARWTSPLKMFEYMAAGRPILASDLPVLREVLHDENSLICAAEQPTQWVETLHWLRQAPHEADQRARRARADVRQYAWQARVRRCLEDWG